MTGSKQFSQPLDVFRGSGPGGGEADDGVGGVVGFPDVEADLGGEGFHVVILQDHKLLVGRGFEEEGDAFFLEDGDHVLGAVDGVRGDAAVEVVCEEGVELDAEEAALREEGAMLLDGGEEMLRGLFRDDDGFAAEGADLGSADVEDVAQAGEVRQGKVAGGAGQGVAQAGAVDEQGQSILVRNFLQASQFSARVDGSVLRGQGDVHQARPNHVVLVRIRVAGGEKGLQLADIHLPVMLGEGQYLMSGVLDGTRLMDGDMAGLHRDGALIVCEHGGDDGGVGLRTAHEEVHLALRAVAGLQDFPLSALGIRVVAVAVQLLEIGLDEPLENLGVRTLGIIASEKEHNSLFLRTQRYIKASETANNPTGAAVRVRAPGLPRCSPWIP